MTGIILITAGMISLTIGILLLLQKGASQEVKVIHIIQQENDVEKKVNVAISDICLSENEIIESEKHNENSPLDTNKTTSLAQEQKEDLNFEKESEQNDDNAKKGYDFEKFVVQKFNEKYYSIKRWRGDKYVAGRYAEDTSEPDLLLELKLKDPSCLFAVECKWQSKYYKDGFELSEKNFEKYKQYEEKNNIPVFIVIGIGGTGANPENLYVVKLSSIKYNFLKKDFLSKFEKKDKSKEFYFDCKTIELR